MEALTGPGTPGAESFGDAQAFVANYASELGLSPVGLCSPVHFTDSGELLGGLGGLGDVVCWSDNVDHCISYLNKELVALGLPALYKEDGSGDGVEHGFDLLALVNGASELLNLYQAAMAKLGDMEAEDVRRAGELDYLRMRHGKLKDQVEACEKEIAAVQNKEQQLQSKNKQLISTVKEEKDEIAKLQNALANQKNQHSHEMKKKEQELARMKEKMSQLTTDKKHQRGGTIDILNALPRADGKRGAWRNGKSLGRKEEELYRSQLAKQEQREQVLAQENAKLKQLMNDVSQDLEQLLSISGMERSCPYETFQEQWRSLKNRIKMLGWQAVDTFGSRMSEEDGQDPVISVTDHDKEIIKLKGEVEESRVQIMQLKQCLQEQLFAIATSELPEHLKDSYFLEEQQRLQEEQDMFEEQKQAFERERENFTEAAIRLGWEKKQFEEQKAQFLKQEFLCSLPKLDTRNPIRRFSVPVCNREGQDHEDLLNIRRRVKPVCTPYPRPKVIFTPRRASSELFRRRSLAFNPATPAMSRQRLFLAEGWPTTSPLFSQIKESRKETACQTEMSVKDDPPRHLAAVAGVSRPWVAAAIFLSLRGCGGRAGGRSAEARLLPFSCRRRSRRRVRRCGGGCERAEPRWCPVSSARRRRRRWPRKWSRCSDGAATKTGTGTGSASWGRSLPILVTVVPQAPLGPQSCRSSISGHVSDSVFMAAEQVSRKRASKTHYVEEHHEDQPHTPILEPQSRARYRRPVRKSRYHHQNRAAPNHEYRPSTSSPLPPPHRSSREGSYGHSGEVIWKEQSPPHPRRPGEEVDYVLVPKRPRYQVAELLPYPADSPQPSVQATTTCAGPPPASISTETSALRRAESQTSQSVPIQEEDFVQEEEDSTSSSDTEDSTLSVSPLASDVDDVQSPSEDIKSYERFILRIAKAMDLAVEQPASVESDKVFGHIDRNQTPPAQLRLIPTLLKMVKESWTAPSSQAQISRRVENLYRTHGADTEFLQKHPFQNSFIVDATQNRARKRFGSVPPDKESKKLDSFGRRFYSLASFVLQAANYVAAMGAYHGYLWNKLLPYLNMLPENKRQRALAYHQEAMTISCQERIAARHIVDAATKQSMTAIALRRHAWLRSSNIPDYARIRIQDLPFDGVGLFDPKTDEILDKLRKMRKTAQAYIAEYYRNSRKHRRRQHTYQP